MFTAPASRPFGIQWGDFGDGPVTLEVALDLPPGSTLLEW